MAQLTFSCLINFLPPRKKKNPTNSLLGEACGCCLPQGYSWQGLSPGEKAVPEMAPTVSQHEWSCAPTWHHACVPFNSLVWTQTLRMYQLWATMKWSIVSWHVSPEEPCGVSKLAEKSWESRGGGFIGSMQDSLPTKPGHAAGFPSLNYVAMFMLRYTEGEGRVDCKACLGTPLNYWHLWAQSLKRQSYLQGWGTSCSTRVQLWRQLLWGDFIYPEGVGGHFHLPCLELNCRRGNFCLHVEPDLNLL